jgi:Skp family chaperone for outer membrane proteins
LGLSRGEWIAIIPPLSGSRRPRTAVDRADPSPSRQQGVHPVKRQLSAFVVAATVAIVHGSAFAQVPVRPVQPVAAPAAAALARSASPASHVAVVDVGYIFKNHARFKAEMDRMKDQVMAAENSLKAEQERIKGLMDQLKGYNPGTPEYRKFEGEVAKAQGDFSVNAQLQKKDFMDREAKVYLQVYNEIERAVSQFARDHGIAVVHRFDGDPVDASDRNRILGSITKPIVYYDPQIDITPDVLKMLNGATVAAQPQPGQPRR